MRYIRPLTLCATVLVAAAGLAGCGSLSRSIAPDGSSAAQLRWPAPGDTDALHRGGSWPAPASVRHIQAGMTKHQVMALVGSPQFGEGWGVHEWDYLFHLRDVTTGQASACQYKVLFDRRMVARSFYWKPQGCARLIKPIAHVTVTHAAGPSPTPALPHAATLPMLDLLFAFDQSGYAQALPTGRVRLHQALDELRQRVATGATLVVNGYAGRLGTSAYNLPLSRKRADAVRDYLISEGIPGAAIRALGHGVQAPIVDCDAIARRDLIACLAPNRRVQIVVKPGSGMPLPIDTVATHAAPAWPPGSR